MTVTPPPSPTARRLLAATATRRRFLTLTGAAAAVALSPAVPAGAARSVGPFRPKEEPFKIGVASGDPLPDAVVIWTRLVTDPVAPLGGMPPTPVPVRWEMAEDERFRRVVKHGTVLARRESAHSVHVDVRGLRPWREYFYRFRVGRYDSPVGRTKTSPLPGAHLDKLSIAWASCQKWDEGLYTAHVDIARHGHDVIFFLGDYIYEYPIAGEIRESVPSSFRREAVTLDDYRNRYALHSSDPHLQASRASAAWIVTLDDHEVENNWAGRYSENDDPWSMFMVRRANAFRAYWEHMPLRPPQVPNGPDLPLYRRFAYGDLAEFSVLDTRQYRSDQVPSDSAEWADPARTMIGDTQQTWLLDGLAASSTRWNVLAHQTAIAQLDAGPGAEFAPNPDTWDNYPACRSRVLDGIHERGVNNLVSIAGDLHRSVASDLKLDFSDARSPTIGAELVTTSISSTGDGVDLDDLGRVYYQENPHIKFQNKQRGYLRATITPDEWLADFRVADFVSRPGGTVTTRESLVVENGLPGLERR